MFKVNDKDTRTTPVYDSFHALPNKRHLLIGTAWNNVKTKQVLWMIIRGNMVYYFYLIFARLISKERFIVKILQGY